MNYNGNKEFGRKKSPIVSMIYRHLLIVLLMTLCDSITAQGTDSLIYRIIGSRQKPAFHSYDSYSYDTYRKSSLALNDVDPFNTDRKFIRNSEMLTKWIVSSDLNNKFILPLFEENRVERIMWSKAKHREVRHILGIDREGLNEIFDTSDIFETLIGDKYTDFSVYDDTLCLDRLHTVSPVGKEALAHYDYHILTLNDTTAEVLFSMKGTENIGLNGKFIAVSHDGRWQIKHISMMLPHDSALRYIENLYITQEYGVTPQGEWAMMRNDIMMELRRKGGWGKVCYIKSQTYKNFSDLPIKPSVFKKKGKQKIIPEAEYRTHQFWEEYDPALSMDIQRQNKADSITAQVAAPQDAPTLRRRQSYASQRINTILGYAEANRSMRVPIWILRAYVNDYIPTSHDSKFDIEPVKSLISFNSEDDLRLRFGGSTTALLHPRWFFDGFAAYGTKSHKMYYKSKVTYSFHDKTHSATEFPRCNISMEARYDIANLGERSTEVNHDDLFRSYNWDDGQRMMSFHVQRLTFERDERNGISYEISMRREQNTLGKKNIAGLEKLTTTEACLTLKYTPVRHYYTKTYLSVPVNRELPSVEISHSIGIKALGGQYSYHHTEMKMKKSLFLHEWGMANILLKGGAMWSKAPYPLLLAPAANMSYISDEESFSLVSPAEFLNDRYAQMLLSWTMNGNFIGVIPAVKKWRWKEYLGLRMLWGCLTKKNDPYRQWNMEDNRIMEFPEGLYLMDRRKPYIEGVIGIHNILRVLNIDYIHRFSYRNLPNSHHSGVQFSLDFRF